MYNFYWIQPLSKKQLVLLYYLFYILTLLIITSCSIQNNETLLKDVDYKQMAQISLNLEEMGVPSQIIINDDGLYTIKVPKKFFNISNQAVLDLGIYDKNNIENQIFKFVTKSSLIETPQELQFKFNQLLSLQLSLTVSSLDHVINARVFISNTVTNEDINSTNLIQDNTLNNSLKASVYVKVTNLPFDYRAILINNIKKIVSGAVVGLDMNSISVVIDEV